LRLVGLEVTAQSHGDSEPFPLALAGGRICGWMVLLLQDLRGKM